MTTDPGNDAILAQCLTDVATCGARMIHAVAEITELERRTAAAAARWLPAADAPAATYADATSMGLGIDAAEEALAHAAPRIATLTRSYDRIARAVRRTVALARRLQQGWPGPCGTPGATPSDDRSAMLLRQAVRRTRAVIRAHTGDDAEAAERYFDDLNAHLDDPAFTDDLRGHPVAEIVEILCEALGLPANLQKTPRRAGLSPPPQPSPAPPPGSG